MIPLHDDNSTDLKPVITVSLILACGLVFFWQATLPPDAAQRAVYSFGMVPAVVFGSATLPTDVAVLPAPATIVTSMFLHGGLIHLLGNMLFLWIFGNNVEDSMGHIRFVVFYLLCGLAAAFAQALQDPGSTLPMIGASGAIGGVLGGYAMLFPRAHVLVLLPLGFFMHLMRIPALIALGLWFLLQFLYTAMAGDQPGGVAYWAHIGGFVAGMILIVPFRSRRFPLFGGPRRGARPARRRRGPWG